jgi:hypothetical protein
MRDQELRRRKTYCVVAAFLWFDLFLWCRPGTLSKTLELPGPGSRDGVNYHAALVLVFFLIAIGAISAFSVSARMCFIL